MVAAKRNAVPLQKAWLELPPSSEVMAGNAAAMMTASRAEINAVRFKVKNAIQKRPDLPANTLRLRGLGGVSGVVVVSSAGFSIEGWLVRLDMLISPEKCNWFSSKLERILFIPYEESSDLRTMRIVDCVEGRSGRGSMWDVLYIKVEKESA